MALCFMIALPETDDMISNSDKKNPIVWAFATNVFPIVTSSEEYTFQAIWEHK